MMQSFRVSDALRCILLNTPKCPNLAEAQINSVNHAALQNRGLQNRGLHNLGLWKQVLTQPENRITLVSWNGVRLAGLVSARTCNGRVWELDHLYLPHSGNNGVTPPNINEAATLDLLGGLVQLAGERRAERILLRLPSDTPAIGLAQRAGFFPYAEETLMHRPLGSIAGGDGPATGLLTELFQVKQAQDDYGLFQLFSASTPSSVRMVMGLTCDQWQDLQSLWPSDRQEWIAEHEGKIIGWLGLFQRRGHLEGKVMVHPKHPELIESLTRLALSRPGNQRWLAPNYQETVCDQLSYRGLQEAARFTMLINTVAAPVVCAGMAPVEA